MKGIIAITLFTLCLGGKLHASEFPLSSSQMDELMNRSKKFATMKPERQQDLRDKASYLFHFAASIAAKDAYRTKISAIYDASQPEEVRRGYIAEAEKAAEAAAKETIDKWLKFNVDGRKPTIGALEFRMIPSNPATENFHEWSVFLTKEGKVDYRTREFGQSTTSPVEKRTPVNPLVWADDVFKGSPADRTRLAEEFEARRKKWAAEHPEYSTPRFYAPSSGFGGGGGGYSSTHSCGTPSANVGALRPEFNGMR